jgi:UDP-N-acetylglucosamine:LPS N-acetylglucosamine transferase
MNKTIHIWFTKAGGGHESTAKTLLRLFKEYYPRYNVRLIDMFEMEPKWYQRAFEKSYPLLIEKFSLVWRILNYGWKYQWFCVFCLSLLPDKAITFWFEREKPVFVISTYYCLGQIHGKINEDLNISRYITVVCDIFTPTRPWFAHTDFKSIVFSKHANNYGIKQGVDHKNIHQYGLLVHPKFLIQPQPDLLEAFRKTLHVNSESKTIMILGGGEGLPNGADVFREILNVKTILNIIVVCGRNERFRSQCDLLNSSVLHYHNVNIYGFVDTMYELMSVSDIIITKAGPGVILEAAALGKYLLICYAIAPQELGNIDYVVEKSLGEFIPNAKLIAARLVQLLPKLPMEIKHTIDFEKHPKKLVDFLIDKTL